MKALKWIIICISGIVLIYAGAIAALLLAGSSPAPERQTADSSESGILNSIFGGENIKKDASNPLSDWTNAELAGQLCILGARSKNVEEIKLLADKGIAGLILTGSDPAPDLQEHLKTAREFQHRGIRTFFVADEEGGKVQRMRPLIGSLASAREVGQLNDVDIRNLTFEYGQKLKNLGIDIVFAPTADLDEEGANISVTARAFGADPNYVAQKAIAWSSGMRSAGVPTVIKHWPGLGGARDTHQGTSTVPSLAELEKRDLIPFDAAFQDGCNMVMVGHVISSGLTEPNTPTSMSEKAMKYLRKQAGNKVVIITDSLNMVAASKSLGITPEEAAIRALIAGVDLALVNAGRLEVVTEIESAIDSGRLSRELAEEKVRRTLAIKAEYGLAPEEYAIP